MPPSIQSTTPEIGQRGTSRGVRQIGRLEGTEVTEPPQVLDSIAISLLFLILAQPYPLLLPAHLGTHVGHGLQLSLIGVLVALSVRSRSSPQLIIGIATLSFAVILQLIRAFDTEAWPRALSILSWHLPLATGAALSVTTIRISRERATVLVVSAVSTSGAIAIAMHMCGPEVVLRMAGDLPQTQQAEASGRMYWYGCGACLCVPLILFTPCRRGIAWGAIALNFAGVVMTMNRTIMVAFPAATAMGCVLLSHSTLTRIRTIVVTIIGVAAIVTAVLLASDERAVQVFWLRVAGGEREFDHAFTSGRVPLYIEYGERLREHWVFGQGLGVPTAISASADIPDSYTTDISFVSIWLTLGVAGPIGLLALVLGVHGRLKRADASAGGAHAVTILWIGVVASLNIDLLTRSPFIIAIAVLASCNSDTPTGRRTRSCGASRERLIA